MYLRACVCHLSPPADRRVRIIMQYCLDACKIVFLRLSRVIMKQREREREGEKEEGSERVLPIKYYLRPRDLTFKISLVDGSEVS